MKRFSIACAFVAMSSTFAHGQDAKPERPHVPLSALELIAATHLEKKLVCKNAFRRHHCEQDFDVLIAKAQEIASLAFASTVASRDGNHALALQILNESRELLVEFRRLGSDTVTRHRTDGA
jgi:hypothetical protein